MNRKGLKLRLSLLLLCIAALPALVACSLFFTEADMQLLDTAVAAEAERLKISVAPAEVLSQQLESQCCSCREKQCAFGPPAVLHQQSRQKL